jgi:peptidoglycan hydrolase-like protein with peptidoglycan-binding domain
MALALVISGASVASAEGMGDSGAGVSMIQADLISLGYSIPAGATGYYGSQTSAAVSAFQAAYASEILAPLGLTAPTGYAGTLTKAKIAAVKAGSSTTSTYPAGCTSATGYSSTTGQPCSGSTSTTTGPSSLAGTDGSISDVDTLSQYSNEEVGDGQSDIKVHGIEVEASNDGDIEIKSMKLSFDATGNTGSDNLDDYIDGAKVWMGSTEVGTVDAEDFSEGSSGVYTKTVTVKAGTVIKADATEKFYVTVDGKSNLDSGDISGDSWTVGISNIRFIDGSGVTTTDDSTGDLATSVGLNFVSFATAANTELKVSTDSTTPEAGIVIIDDTDSTDDVVILKGKLKLEGTSDAIMDEFPVTLTSSTFVSNVTGNVTLTIGGQTFSETVAISAATSGTVTFDNLDFAIDAGETVNFTVTADINDMDNGNTLDEGETLTGSISSTNRDYIDVENEEGDQFDDSSEKSGTATGEAQEFRTTGINLTFVSASTSVAAGTSTNDDQGTFLIKFKVRANGDTVYVSTLADAALATVTAGKTSANIDRAGTATVGGTSAVLTNVTDTDLNAAGLYMIEEGEEHTFELSTSVQLPAAGAAGLFRSVLGGMYWDTDSTDATPDNLYNSNLDTFKTSYVGLN